MTSGVRYRPMLAREVHEAFDDQNWIFEIKWDGFRAIAYVDESVSLRSRNNQELVRNFPELEELKKQASDVVVDGEIVIMRAGKVDFQSLLERRRIPSPKQIWLQTKHLEAVYVVFDILEKDGKALVDQPLIERKKILAQAVKEGPHVILADYVEGKGKAYYQIAIDKGLEGIMAKKKDSYYEGGLRSGDWLKIKKEHALDAVIFGYTQGEGVRDKSFGSLVMGLFDKEGKPVYIGNVGSGFSEKTIETLMENFQRLKTDKIPFEVEGFREVIWLIPELVAEITYQFITRENRLRIAQFQKLRTDKPARECTIDQMLDESKKQPLTTYEEKRNFEKTPEPSNIEKKQENLQKIFVVQEHHARRLHYDFRLERNGVLVSWAVPKGIPLSSDEKRLAVQTEDHPYDYAKFEGEIPKGEYGAGEVVIWDKGTFETKVWSDKLVEVILNGSKLKGRYVLVPLKSTPEKKNWLMLKGKDEK
jgi:DNA ligase D-like protein (predicted ligase)/DNA ligase D-like protein (predicted 3'-phosphoesterase)